MRPRLKSPRASAFCLALVVLASGVAHAQKRVPRFRDYPVREIYRGKAAPVVLTPDNRIFRTRLREAARQRPNFAGRYVVTSWGCGTGCRLGGLVDLKTGRVHWFPHRLCCWPYGEPPYPEPLEFRPDSRLIVLTGGRGETETSDGEIGVHFYKFERGRFVHLHTEPVAERR